MIEVRERDSSRYPITQCGGGFMVGRFHQKNLDYLARRIAVVRREGEIAEHKKLCDDCEPGRPCERIKHLEQGT